MRLGLALAVFLTLSAGLSAGAAGDSEICGRPRYPDASAYDPFSVSNDTLWQRLLAVSGFGDAAEARGATDAPVTDGNRVHIVSLREVVVREYPGGVAETTLIALTVRDEVPGPGVVAEYNFTLINTGGRSGGNITLRAWVNGSALEIFWRWAYIQCTEDFAPVYYVFHGRIDGGAVADDNTLVYHESPRPRRSPPVDLILLITAGAAVSVIFLLGRRALKKETEPRRDSETKRIK